MWAASTALLGHDASADAPADVRRRDEPCAPPGRRLDLTDPRRRRTRRGDEPGRRGKVRPDAHRSAFAAGPAAQLTGREQELVRLAAEKPHPRADRRAAPHQHPDRPLHLDRIRDKTGCRRRADLTRLARSHDLV